MRGPTGGGRPDCRVDLLAADYAHDAPGRVDAYRQSGSGKQTRIEGGAHRVGANGEAVPVGDQVRLCCGGDDRPGSEFQSGGGQEGKPAHSAIEPEEGLDEGIDRVQ